MPYRQPGRTPVPSPDVDERLFQTPWWRPLLILTIFFLPPQLALTWLVSQTVHCGGPSHPETLGEKISFTVVAALWVAVLLFARSRHQRRLRAALAALEEPSAAGAKIRVEANEPPTPPRDDEVEAEGSSERENVLRAPRR